MDELIRHVFIQGSRMTQHNWRKGDRFTLEFEVYAAPYVHSDVVDVYTKVVGDDHGLNYTFYRPQLERATNIKPVMPKPEVGQIWYSAKLRSEYKILFIDEISVYIARRLYPDLRHQHTRSSFTEEYTYVTD